MQLGYILAVADKHHLDEKYWKPAADLIETLIVETVADLLDELDERTHYAQPAALPYTDAYVYRVRVTIVAGYLAAFGIFHRLVRGIPTPGEDRIKAFLDKIVELELPVIKSEGQVPLIANITLFYQLLGETEEAETLIAGCILPIFYLSDKDGMYDPYIDVQDIIRTELGITLTPVRRNFGRNSYVNRPGPPRRTRQRNTANTNPRRPDSDVLTPIHHLICAGAHPRGRRQPAQNSISIHMLDCSKKY